MLNRAVVLNCREPSAATLGTQLEMRSITEVSSPGRWHSDVEYPNRAVVDQLKLEGVLRQLGSVIMVLPLKRSRTLSASFSNSAQATNGEW
jgi:hypothetical protein